MFKIIMCISYVLYLTHPPPTIVFSCETSPLNVPIMNKFCSLMKVEKEYHVDCFLHNSDVFSFNIFRKWSLQQNTSSIKLHIECNGGFIMLPWPFKSPKLTKLSVNGCVAKDLLSEIHETSSSYQNQLEVVILRNTVFKINSTKMANLSKKLRTITADHECGPRNVKRYIWRNVSAVLHPHSESISTFRVDPKQSCIFSVTVEFENSFVNKKSSFSLQMLVGKTIFLNLKVLNYTASALKSVPKDLELWRLHYPSLLHLDLSHNSISGFKFTDYTYNHMIRGHIDLRFNNLTILSMNELESFKQLNTTFIDVRNNTCQCECGSIGDLHLFFVTYKDSKEAGLLSNYSYLWDLQCHSPKRLRGKTISKLTKDEICDSDEGDFIILISVLSIVVVILVIIVVLVTRYRKEITILIFTRIYIVLPCGSDIHNCDTKMYDAFVSYSAEDSEWVMSHLLTGLEHEKSGWGFKACIRDRDFLIGHPTSEQIVASVENSRHTILVVSKNFVQNEWCLLEFRTALNESLHRNKHHMIIILLNDIDVAIVEPDLRRCLQTRTYIDGNDRLFWDRLRFALNSRSVLKTPRANAVV